jgi:hypothetical protein
MHTMFGQPKQNYRAAQTTYAADATGKISNVADSDVATLVAFGCAEMTYAREAAAPTVRTVTGTTDTLLASDAGNVVYYTSASGITLTVPAGLGGAFQCVIATGGTGDVTPTAGAGVTLNNRQSHTKTAGQWSVASLVAIVADTLIWAGDTA